MVGISTVKVSLSIAKERGKTGGPEEKLPRAACCPFRMKKQRNVVSLNPLRTREKRVNVMGYLLSV